MNLTKSVFLYRQAEAVSDPLQPEIGFVTADLEGGKVNVVGFTHHGSLFALMGLPVQTNYDEANPGDFATLSPVQTKARVAKDKADAEAKAKADQEAAVAKKKADDEAAAAKAKTDAEAAAKAAALRAQVDAETKAAAELNKPAVQPAAGGPPVA